MNNLSNALDHFAGKKILITGNTGFKGSWLSIFLKSIGSDVYGLSDKPYEGIYKMANVNSILSKQEYLNLNDVSLEKLIEVFNEINPEIVFHFSAQSLVPVAMRKPIETLSTNIIGTYKILHAANSCESIKIVTVATTDKVYKFPQNENKEDADLGSFEYYSASKVGQENVVDAFINVEKRDNLNILKIRSGNVIGGGDRADSRLMTDLIEAANSRKNINIRNPISIRPWTYVLDSLYGYLMGTIYCLDKSQSDIFNLNSELDNEYNVEYITKKYSELNNNCFNVDVTPNTLKEVDELRINSDKALNCFGWKAIIGVDSALEKIMNWENYYRNNSDTDYSHKEVLEYMEALNGK